ncbi:MAG: phosphatase PAP2 family protein [Pirellulales bacterium]|nr:phosphatase PAP2 family protein [Pirellulales bacterium]
MMRTTLTLAILAGTLGAILSDRTSASDVRQWNTTLRAVIQADVAKADPGWSTRSMAMTNGAIYDVYQAFQPTHKQFLYQGAAPAGASRDAAVAQAAYTVLSHVYGSQQAQLDVALTAALATIPDGAAKTAGASFGATVGQAYINARLNDNASVVFPYATSNDPGRWRPDPMHPGQEAWGPGWGTVPMFSGAATTDFHVPGVPDMHSQAYTDAYNEVKTMGALVSPERDAVGGTEIALFWAYDRPGMGPPPVLYNRNLHDVSIQFGNTPEQDALLFAMASVAMADAAIAAWDVKFTDDFWRPIAGIREADTDGNPDTIADPTWIPLGAPGNAPNDWTDDFTPPFPAYVSGHATMGAATFETLRRFYGVDVVNFTLNSDELAPGSIPDEMAQIGVDGTRDFASFSEAEWENAYSRIYMGIHWIFDATDGIALGREVAGHVMANHFAVVPEPTAAGLLALGLTAWGVRAGRRRRC